MSSTENSEIINVVTKEARVKGICKWFNNKSGYGFLTVTDGEKKDMDIFVHHSSLHVGNENQYKYLVQGEYVDFTLSNIDKSKNDSKHEFHATSVTGVNNGKLMCETRNEIRNSKSKLNLKESDSLNKNKIYKNDNLEKKTELRKDNSDKSDWIPVKSKTLGNVARGRGRPKKNN